MIKHINHQNFSTTPFVAAKSWDLYNVQNSSLITLESSGSDYQLALDYIDYNTGIPLLDRVCDIALEQQTTDILFYQEGITGSGQFDPDNDVRNTDGTYKRSVHNQVKNTFYNKRNNPTQIFGVEFIDFPLSQTKRNLSEYFRMFTIPRNVFGEKIQPNSVYLYDTNLDDNVVIQDDGYQNLNAGFNLFSKVQEVKTYLPPTGSNLVLSGSVSNSCPTYNGAVVTASANDTSSIAMSFLQGAMLLFPSYDSASSGMTFISGGTEISWSNDRTQSLRIGYLYGSIQNYRMTEEVAIRSTFFTGSAQSSVITSSEADDAGPTVTFLSGSISSLVYIRSGSEGPSTVTPTFLSGGINLIALPTSGSDLYQSTSSMTFLCGSYNLIAFPTSGSDLYQTTTYIGFLNGNLTL